MGDAERRARAHFDADAWEEDLAGRQATKIVRTDLSLNTALICILWQQGL